MISDAGGLGNAGSYVEDIDVTWNAQTNEYLVVWSAVDTEAGGIIDDEIEIYGQLLDAHGDRVGLNDFRISDSGGSGDTSYFARKPAVTWNAFSNEYLVTWQANDPDAGLDEFEVEIFGQRLDAGGAAKGANDFRISDVRGTGVILGSNNDSAFAPDVVANSRTGEYLVTWMANDTDGTNNPDEGIDVFGQLLDMDGNEIGINDFQISDLTGGNFFFRNQATVVYNSRDDQYFVTWASTDVARGLDESEREIFGQLLSASGQRQLDEDLRISDAGGEGSQDGTVQKPDVIWNSLSNEYLVAWGGVDPDAGEFEAGEHEVYVQRVSAAGTEIGINDFKISEIGPPIDTRYDAWRPNIAWDSARNEYFVSFIGDTEAIGGAEVFVQRLQVQEAIQFDISGQFNVDMRQWNRPPMSTRRRTRSTKRVMSW